MGMIDSNILLAAAPLQRPHHQDEVGARALGHADRSVLIFQSRKRDTGSGSENTRHNVQMAKMSGVVDMRIRALEEELRHYRLMVDDLVRQRTEKLSRRISILEYCNSSLSENCLKIQQRYLDLMLKSQVQSESGMD